MARNGGPKHSGLRLSAVERQAAALRLRTAGIEFGEIAAQLGYAGKQGAYKAVATALARTVQEPADELRTLECARLDAALAAIWPKVLAGNGWAIDRMLGIMDRRARYLGLDAPLKREDTQTLTIRLAAEQIAAETGLSPDEVIAEAERIVAIAGHDR